MKQIKIILIIQCIPFLIFSQDWRWEYQCGSTNSDGSIIRSDINNNLYLGGGFSGPQFVIGSDTLFQNNGNLFLIKLDENGNVNWKKSLHNSSPSSCYRANILQIDNSAQSLYVVGSFCGTINLDCGSYFSTHETGYLSRFDFNGNCIWTKQITSSRWVEILCATVDGFGDFYISGFVQDTTDFDSFSLPKGAFIAKYDSAGNCLFAKNICSAVGSPILPYLWVRSIYFMNDYLFISGIEQHDTILIDTLSFIHPNKGGNFIGKYDDDGNRVWLKEQVGVSVAVSFEGLSVDNNGNSYTCGYFKDSLFIDGTTYVADPGNHKYFISKYDSSGNLEWFKQGTSTESRANNIYSDSSGNFYVSGYFSGTEIFGSISITALEMYNSFLARYNSLGICLGVKNFGNAQTIGLTVDLMNRPTIASVFSDSILVDNSTYYTYGNTDLFISQSDVITGIEETEKRDPLSLIIYRNPNNGKFNIDIPVELLKGNSSVELTIFDSQGKLVLKSPLVVNHEIIPVNIETEATGIYLVRLSNKDKVYTGRVIFEK